MRNRRAFRILLTIICFVFAGLNGYHILTGNYAIFDVFLLVIFLVFGSVYLFMLLKEGKAKK